ncbi:MAG: aminoglycoside phosphotransferase family protein [Alphaproteobacteria bacterium]|nr:aminoglycoside phosphotransferase family protein [Alphaproteobacteria bacterium]MBV8408163.1 aminoglycoside phosphotransferase family protein [Alphaproteobacteria bacterium]
MPSFRVADEIQDLARRLCPHPVREVDELSKGNNSRIFRIETAAATFALKKYPASDERNRLGAEVAAVRFFERKAIPRTPRVVAVAPEIRYALFTWVEGGAVEVVADEDVAEFARFQIALDQAIDEQARKEIGEASEACLSGPRIVSHIEWRYRRLETVKDGFPAFRPFFDDVLVPSLRRFEAEARSAYARLGFAFADDLAPSYRTLIPSDMGAHNALRGADGHLWFLDFEYFGWDDPLTSIANFVMHPGMQLSERQRQLYREVLLGHFRRHGESGRLTALMPLYALRWCAIILGELLPERWRHRVESNPDFGDWDKVRHAQIAKARAVIGNFQK